MANPFQAVGGFWNDITGTTTNNQFNAEQAETQREWEAEQAKINREWQENMSNTAYQRAVKDMKEAGLNPALMYQSGIQGASTPSGATGRGSQATASGIGAGASLINSAVTLAIGLKHTAKGNAASNQALKLINEVAERNHLASKLEPLEAKYNDMAWKKFNRK